MFVKNTRNATVYLAVLLFSGCSFEWSPTGNNPTAVNQGNADLSAWSPCVCVHNPGGIAKDVQFEAIRKLQTADRMRWIRLDTSLSNPYPDYHFEARSMGLKIFSNVTLEDLDRLGWENAFDRIYQTYPGDIYEIAGEISNPDPYVNTHTVTPEYYMDNFKRLYAYVRQKYLGVVLASAPTFGSGTKGAAELERFIRLGLLDMDVVVAVNVYSDSALQAYAAVFDRYGDKLSQKRVWITETGIPNPDKHVAWVKNFYPRLRNALHPEMICWYTLWGGDGGVDNGFGMLNNVERPPAEYRPLFTALTTIPNPETEVPNDTDNTDSPDSHNSGVNRRARARGLQNNAPRRP